jgi:glycosyltransferase involved in cell wall biosynthesis
VQESIGAGKRTCEPRAVGHEAGDVNRRAARLPLDPATQRIPLPSPSGLRAVAEQRFDVMLGQAGSELIELGVWLRAAHGVPFVAVNTIHLPSVYNTILPDFLNRSAAVRAVFERGVVPWLERHSVHIYNEGDGLIVLSEGMARYWRSRGVTVPISVIARAVEPKIFDATPSRDPFDARAKRGQRLLCVCRHAREKSLDRLLEIFASWIAPVARDATLTLVGDGPDHDAIRATALRLGVADRVFFPGEHPVTETVDFYRHADVFVYTSLSETYGQVVSEALWCGLPVVALADQMGVSDQVHSGHDGVLIASDTGDERVNWRFASEVNALLRHPETRLCFGAQAAKNARLRSDPARCIQRYYETFASARAHCAATWRPSSRRAQLKPLVRWAAIHGGLLGLGLLRAPAQLNRHGRKQPSWHALTPALPRLPPGG